MRGRTAPTGLHAAGGFRASDAALKALPVVWGAASLHASVKHVPRLFQHSNNTAHTQGRSRRWASASEVSNAGQAT